MHSRKGGGGSSKTRLALKVAHTLVTAEHALFPDGVGWIELASLADPAQVVIAICGLHEQPGRAPIQTLLDVFARKTLLVLDNCEHLAAACATLADTLLHACPHLRILTTSREPLGVAGETLWLTPPLASDIELGELLSLNIDSVGISSLGGKYAAEPTLREISEQAYALRDAEQVE